MFEIIAIAIALMLGARRTAMLMALLVLPLAITIIVFGANSSNVRKDLRKEFGDDYIYVIESVCRDKEGA